MRNRRHAFLFIALFALLLSSCSKPPPRFEEASIEMSLQDFKTQYPDAQKIAAAKGKEGTPFSVYRMRSDSTFKKADCFFSKDKLVGMIILFSEGVAFDSVVDALAAANGEPAQQFMMANSKAAIWENGIYFINMVQGATQTEIKLPTGESQILNPGDIVVMFGRKSE